MRKNRQKAPKRYLFSPFLLTLCLALCLSLFSCKKEENEEGVAAEQTPTAIPTVDISAMDMSFTDGDMDSSFDAATATRITFAGAACTVSGAGAQADGANATVTAAGTYVISGYASDAHLTVDAPDTAKLRLVLQDLTLHSAAYPAIYIRQADKVFLTLAEGSSNSLSDGTGYTVTDSDSTPDGVLFSKADLTVNGNGTLTVSGNNKHGVVSKDDLVITGGNLTVTATGVALNGKDCVKINGGAMTLTAGSDGIRSDNEEEGDRGFVYIADGALTVTAENDGIQAQTVLKIDGGTLKVTTGGGSANTSTTQSGGYAPGWGSWGSSDSTSTADSAKGLKADSDILIAGGTVIVDSSDDSIHSNTNVEITSGTLTLTSGDDGVHANTALGIMGGTLTVTKSYEGLEAGELLIAGGSVTVTASDDGLNAAGGNDGSATSAGGRPGAGSFSSSTGKISITGGILYVNAAGDGIDSNGSITVSGGITLVTGPTNSGNGAFDYDGSAAVSGGVLIALGSSGMAQGFSTAQNQGAILVSFSTQAADTALSLCDADGNVIVSFTPPKTYSSAAITAPGITENGTYRIVAGGTVAGVNELGFAQSTTLTGGTTLKTLTMSSLIYGSSSGMGGGGMMPPR